MEKEIKFSSGFRWQYADDDFTTVQRMNWNQVKDRKRNVHEYGEDERTDEKAWHSHTDCSQEYCEHCS